MTAASAFVLALAACGGGEQSDRTDEDRDRGGDADAAPPPTAKEATHQALLADQQAVRHPGDGGGSWGRRAGPIEVEVGEPVTLTAAYVAGPHGIAVGGALVLIPSPFWGWSPPQVDQPDGPGFVRLTPPDGVGLAPSVAEGQLWARVTGRALAEGEVVEVRYRGRADRFAERAGALWLGVDTDGDGVRALLPEPVGVRTRPGPPARVVATWPSTAEPGDEVFLTLAVVDAAGNAFGRHPVTLTLSGAGGLGLPDTVALAAADEGRARLAARPTSPGVYTVSVTGVGPPTRTNPLIVREGAEPLLWADLQIHSALSDGTGDPADVWRYAREVAGLDAAAITDHDHWGLRFLDGAPELRARLDAAVDAAHDPGRFVALHGYEYTHWRFGHRHVLYFDGPGPVHSAYAAATATPEALWRALEGRRALTVPHHVAGGPIALDWGPVAPPGREPVVEVASVHGQSAVPGSPGQIGAAVRGAFALDQWAEGRRFAVIGSTDGHDGHPGLAQLAGGSGGLAAIAASARTRSAVYEALRAGRTYATNGPRIVLRMLVGGAPWGTRPAGEATPVEVRVAGTAPIRRVTLLGREGAVGSRRGDGPLLHATWTLDAPRPDDFVAVEVLQEDGGMAWSSPVFFDASEGGGSAHPR